MSPRSQGLIAAELQDEEILRWTGHPVQPVLLKRFVVYLLPVMLLCWALSFFHIILSLTFLTFTLIIFIAPSLQIYALTDRRLFIINRVPLGRSYTVPLGKLMWNERIAMRDNYVDGVGTIWIYAYPSYWRGINFIVPIFTPAKWFGGSIIRQALFNIEDSAEVEALLPRNWHERA